jgi:predicted DNA binding CopG/RHH family protein
MMKKDKIIPKFKNEDEEREFWAIHSPLDYFDTKDFKRASFPKLKPSLKSISIRLPEDMLAELKTLANKKDVPYQSLAKMYLARQISLERGSFHTAPNPDKPEPKRFEDKKIDHESTKIRRHESLKA